MIVCAADELDEYGLRSGIESWPNHEAMDHIPEYRRLYIDDSVNGELCTDIALRPKAYRLSEDGTTLYLNDTIHPEPLP